MVPFDELFSASNEHEGSEVARQIVTALLDSGVAVAFVTHMFELARAFLDDGRTCFLRAERGTDGTRSCSLATAKSLRASGATCSKTVVSRHGLRQSSRRRTVYSR